MNHDPDAFQVTDERFVLDERPPRSVTDLMIRCEHFARYQLAGRHCADRRVLEAACGSGWGSPRLVAAGARQVVALDLAAVAVRHARWRHGGEGVEHIVGDATRLPFADGAFGLVVQVETIEHVPDPRLAIAEAARVLAAGGTYLVSTPNRLLTAKDEHGQPTDPYHVHELDPAELDELLQEHFATVRLYGQIRVSAVRKERRRLRAALQRFVGCQGIERARGLRDRALGPLFVRLKSVQDRTVAAAEPVPVDVAELADYLYMIAVCGAG